VQHLAWHKEACDSCFSRGFGQLRKIRPVVFEHLMRPERDITFTALFPMRADLLCLPLRKWQSARRVRAG
jgi:hypothetical protein